MRTPIWIAAAAILVLAAGTYVYTTTLSEPDREAARRADLSPEEIAVLELCDAIEKSPDRPSRERRDRVVLVPGDAISAVQQELETRTIDLLLVNDWDNINYFFNQIIPEIRKRKSVWIVYDHRAEAVSAAMAKFLLRDHRVAFDQKFEPYTLLRVVNEFSSDETKPKVSLARVARAPWLITDVQFSPGGDTMFVTTKDGHVQWHAIDGSGEGVALTIPRLADGDVGLFEGGESGLLGMVCHPGYENNRRVFIHYNYQSAETREGRVSEWAMEVSDDGATRTMTNERIVLRFPQPNDTHNAGQLLFGSDGLLYIAVGDGSDGDYLTGRGPSHSMRGKILRIDVDTGGDGEPYTVPPTNPFVGNDKFPPEVLAWGFRNPWRMSFTPDGELITGDIGEDAREEITFVRPGRHHGWPFFEGTVQRSDWPLGDEKYYPPVVEYDRTVGMSIVGGYVYDGDAMAWLKGKYVFGDYLSGRIWAIDLPSQESNTPVPVSQMIPLGRWPRLFTTFGRDPSGEIYVADLMGDICKIGGAEGGGEPTTDPATATGMTASSLRGMFLADPPAPARNDIGEHEAALGRTLYEDTRLSRHGDVSCATCHDLANFGQDGKQTSPGTGGAAGRRNTPSAFNAHRQYAQFWDYRAQTVEQQATMALLDSREHGLADEAELVGTLKGIPDHVAAFEKAYPGSGVTAENAGKAIGAFVRQLVTSSRWDRFLDGEDAALTAEEQQGLITFVVTGCITCHQYRLLGGGMPQKLGLMKPVAGDDKGYAEISGNESQAQFFKVPSLLNVGKTAPYYHDGSVATLEEAVRHMADVQLNRQLTPEQVRSMVVFLNALTGDKPEILR